MPFALIVDDNRENREILVTVLRAKGFEVETAGDGAEALAIARVRPPDIAVTDLLMPVMDGFALLRHWRADPMLSQVPIVVYTATYTDPEDAKLALGLGAAAFFVKPMEPAEFIDRIVEVLDRRAALPRPIDLDAIVDEGLLERYNAALVRKLERRTEQLERARRDLAAREARLRAILAAEPEGVVLTTSTGVLIEANPAALALLEIPSPESCHAVGLLSVAVEGDRERAAQMIRRVCAGASEVLELRMEGLRGSARWLEIHATPLRDQGGDVVAALAILRDVTARKEAEIELRDAKDRLQLAVAAGRVGLWDWDFRSERVVYSREWKRQLGYEEEEIVDTFSEWESRLHPDDRDEALRVVESYLESDADDYASRFRLRHRDGSYRHILARGTAIRDDRGERLRVLGSHVDLTDYDLLQAQLFQAQKMETIGRLAAGIAHDFNNLLTVILSSTDCVLAGVDPESPLREDLEEVRRAGERAAALTKRLLTFGRREIAAPRPIRVEEVIREMVPMLRRLIAEDIELSVDADGKCGVVRADPGQIEQVIVNLAVNAQDAMPHGGKLAIAVSELESAGERSETGVAPPPAGWVRVRVEDSGSGIDAATRARMFEPFFTTKGLGKGTGLGLAVVHEIVRQGAGRIAIESGPGCGTVVLVDLPKISEETVRPTRQHGPTMLPGSETIVLAEDDDALRRVAGRVLTAAGYEVLVARSAEDALAMLDRTFAAVDLLFTDIVMPGMSGIELAQRVLQKRPDVKVLYTSGYTEDDALRRGIGDGTIDFLPKPYSMADLTRRVRQVLDSRG